MDSYPYQWVVGVYYHSHHYSQLTSADPPSWEDNGVGETLGHWLVLLGGIQLMGGRYLVEGSLYLMEGNCEAWHHLDDSL